ncbi:MAG: hypothetical protein CME64_06925 [Halobacteriovoraceae bacterium]|nr:hypothetical protein [Halobacteriovoraceae bacterium]|tara:strand:+ start:5633 stop:6166 length:534 start_codon:yes stop_codon:yes gene_type:complete
MKLFLLATLVMLNGTAIAAGKGTGSPADLIPAFINLFILLSFLTWILKKPARNYYTEKSDNIKNLLERASVKAKESQMMMDAQRKKIDNVAEEIDTIFVDADKSITKFEADYKAEVSERIDKMKQDAAAKIEAEKKQAFNKLNNNFLDEVIGKAKSHIKSNPELSTKATNSALEGLK